jgi:hypothetical protein
MQISIAEDESWSFSTRVNPRATPTRYQGSGGTPNNYCPTRPPGWPPDAIWGVPVGCIRR